MLFDFNAADCVLQSSTDSPICPDYAPDTLEAGQRPFTGSAELIRGQLRINSRMRRSRAVLQISQCRRFEEPEQACL